MFKKEWIDDDRELAKRYQLGENQNECIQKVRDRYFNMLKYKAAGSKYRNIVDTWDIDSYAMESIHVSLNTYKPDSQVYFYVYLQRVFLNALRSYSQIVMAETKGRNWYLNFEDGNSTKNMNGDEYSLFDAGMGAEDYTDVDDFVFRRAVEEMDFTPNQRKYVDYVLNCTYIPSDAEVAREIGMSRAGVGKLKKSLSDKMISLI